ncbi:MAG TPA: polymer-forming cytoskeletal protein [Polyangiaceae bacterium]|nr:polymer-forming cytoskeletal protein [Polyangiaceae bacterium]
MARHTSDFSTVGSSTRITGRISGEGGLRVEGNVRGDVSLSGPLELAEGATIEGNVEAETIEIAGSLLGDVTSTGPVAIHAGAVVRGEMKAAQVTIEPGSRIAIRLDADFELDLGQPQRRK